MICHLGIDRKGKKEAAAHDFQSLKRQPLFNECIRPLAQPAGICIHPQPGMQRVPLKAGQPLIARACQEKTSSQSKSADSSELRGQWLHHAGTPGCSMRSKLGV